jgi:hypothetical protein
MQDEISGEKKKADSSDHWSTIIQSLLRVPGTYCFGLAVVTWLPMACEITSRPVVTLIPEVATVTVGVTWTLR